MEEKLKTKEPSVTPSILVKVTLAACSLSGLTQCRVTCPCDIVWCGWIAVFYWAKLSHVSTPDCGLAVCLRGRGNELDRTKQQTKNIKLAVTEMPARYARLILASLELLFFFFLSKSLNLTANSCSHKAQLLNFTLYFNVSSFCSGLIFQF